MDKLGTMIFIMIVCCVLFLVVFLTMFYGDGKSFVVSFFTPLSACLISIAFVYYIEYKVN